MKPLLKRFLDICLLRAGPQDLPASGFLLGLALLVYLLTGTLLSSLNLAWWQSLLLVVVDTVILGGLAFVVLWIRHLTGRFWQVFTALLGTGAFFELLALPLLFWQQQTVGAFQGAGQDGGFGVFFSALVLWLCLFWNLVVIGHILRHALSTLMPVGMALAVAYMFISITVSQRLTQFLLAT